MPWFKRKKIQAPELIEPTISLMDKKSKPSESALAHTPLHTSGDVIDVVDMKEVVMQEDLSSKTEAPEVMAPPPMALDVEAPEAVAPSMTEPVEPAVAEADAPAMTTAAITLAEETSQPVADAPAAPDAAAGVSLGKPEAQAKPASKLSSLASRFKRKSDNASADATASIEHADEVADENAFSAAPPKGKLAKAKAAASKARKERARFAAAPIRVVIGFLPEVTERDALEYAVGIAEKHFEQIGMSFFDAFKYGNGFAFEAHEGGTGKAYLPEIIRYFESQGPFRPGENIAAVVRTATRSVEVQRTREGLVAVILPERDETATSDWLTATTSMQPAINKRTGFLVVGATLFTTGFIAMMVTSMLTRYQEYDAAPEPVRQRIEVNHLPSEQWRKIEAVPASSFVRALRYRNGAWEAPEIVATGGMEAPVSAPPSPMPPTPGTPATATPMPSAPVSAAPMPAAPPSALPAQAPVSSNTSATPMPGSPASTANKGMTP